MNYIYQVMVIAPSGTFKMKECRLCVEYIYLDADERKLFAKSNHEYLIKQTQYSLNNIVRSGTKTKTIPLNFFHPVVEIIFVLQNKSKFVSRVNGGNDYFNFSKTNSLPFKDTIKTGKLRLNGIDRTTEMTSKELRLFNPIERHTSVPNNLYIYIHSL